MMRTRRTKWCGSLDVGVGGFPTEEETEGVVHKAPRYDVVLSDSVADEVYDFLAME